jgi:hypothetical protein
MAHLDGRCFLIHRHAGCRGWNKKAARVMGRDAGGAPGAAGETPLAADSLEKNKGEGNEKAPGRR